MVQLESNTGIDDVSDRPRPKGNIALCGRQASIHEACNLYRNKQVAFAYCLLDLI